MVAVDVISGTYEWQTTLTRLMFYSYWPILSERVIRSAKWCVKLAHDLRDVESKC
jgi:hypothetical protein